MLTALKIEEVKVGQEVDLVAPDGYKMHMKYLGYISDVQRYKFMLYVGGYDRTNPTAVLLHRDTMTKYKIQSKDE